MYKRSFIMSDVADVAKKTLELLEAHFPKFGKDYMQRLGPKFPLPMGDAGPHLTACLFGHVQSFTKTLLEGMNISKDLSKAILRAMGKNLSSPLLILYARLVLDMKVPLDVLDNPIEYNVYPKGVCTTVIVESIADLITKDVFIQFLPTTHQSYSELVRQYFETGTKCRRPRNPKKDNEEEVLAILRGIIPLPVNYSWETTLFLYGIAHSGIAAEFDISLVGPGKVILMIIECKRTLSPLYVTKQKKGHSCAIKMGLCKDSEIFTVSPEVVRVFITESLEGDNTFYTKKFCSLFKKPEFLDCFTIKNGSLVVLKSESEENESALDIPEYLGEIILKL